MKIADTLQEELSKVGISVERPERLYPSKAQRSAGAWVWRAKRENSDEYVGSGLPMRQCLTGLIDALEEE